MFLFKKYPGASTISPRYKCNFLSRGQGYSHGVCGIRLVKIKYTKCSLQLWSSLNCKGDIVLFIKKVTRRLHHFCKTYKSNFLDKS
jgi:hypothetical protein